MTKWVLFLTLLHGSSAISDGITTKHGQERCLSCYEGDPIARAFIGRRVTWARMIPAGTAEVTMAAGLGYAMSKSKHKWVRRLAWVPQVTLSGFHIAGAVHNYHLAASTRIR